MMPILTDRRPPSSAMTMGHCASSRLRSTDEPVVTKNSPSSSDRNGRMSASTCHIHKGTALILASVRHEPILAGHSLCCMCDCDMPECVRTNAPMCARPLRRVLQMSCKLIRFGALLISLSFDTSLLVGRRQANTLPLRSIRCSSLKGNRLRAWLRKLVSESSTPAAKAPMVSLKPRR